MAYVAYNPNPDWNLVGDCTVRAIAKIMGKDWDDTYIALAMQGFLLKDMPSANHVWGSYLRSKGFKRHHIPDTCPDCYTVRDFCEDNPRGQFLLATGTHTVTVEDGDYFDSWDSGDSVVLYFWVKEE